MRKIVAATSILAIVCACSKRDPILPGVRTAVFDENEIKILGGQIENLPAAAVQTNDDACPYRQDTSNVIWDGDTRVFSGFPTSNSVKSTQKPVCAGAYVIAGLTTGELVKVHAKTHQIAWMADIYRPSNMTGGASLVDIVAPIVIDGDAVYAGGLGDAFCRVNMNNGRTKWCAPISVSHAFIITKPAAFVLGTGGDLYAVRTTDGAIYWRTNIGKCTTFSYADGVITACKEKIDAANGEPIK